MTFEASLGYVTRLLQNNTAKSLWNCCGGIFHLCKMGEEPIVSQNPLTIKWVKCQSVKSVTRLDKVPLSMRDSRTSRSFGRPLAGTGAVSECL